MKNFIIALMLFSIMGVSLAALKQSASRQEHELQSNQAAWQVQIQQLAEIHAEIQRFQMKINELEPTLSTDVQTTVMDPELRAFFRTNDVQYASLQLQNRVLASFGAGGNSSESYVLVSKASLADAHLKPLKLFPDSEKLTDDVRGVLAITPEEQQFVESAFATAFSNMGVWVRENVQRDGPVGEMVVSYTVPANQVFHEATISQLFSTVNSGIGTERGELLRNYFEHYRIYEDGAVGDHTNLLSIYRISAAPGYGYRSGWRSANAEAINTYPEPIKPEKFPAAFRFLFPSGWKELAQREGFELPKQFGK